MIVHYLATANIPSKSANSLQIIKICEAITSLRHKVKLITQTWVKLITQSQVIMI